MSSGAGSRAPNEAPARIGRYELRREIGRGMMGVVYEAFDPTLDRNVALKTIQLTFPASQRDREGFERRFFAEARAAAALQHPNIVVIHDLGRDEESGVLYMAQERLQGQTLAELTDGKALPWREAARIASRLAAALQAAHDRGIVHRDVKPSNVVLQPDGQPKVLDFGIARLPMSDLTGAGQVFGTPAFMSPEQAQGEPVDPRSDVFSVGSVLYQLLTGRRPFEGESVARILRLVAESDPEPPSRSEPGVPEGADRVVARAMAKRPEDRYATAGELAEDLSDLSEGRAPRHLSAPRGTRPAGVPSTSPGTATTVQPAPTLDLDSELHALVSEPTHDVGAPRTRPWRRLRRGGTLALALAALVAVGLLLGRRGPEAASPAGIGVPGESSRAAQPPVLAPSPIPVSPATITVDFEHHLKSGNLRIWIDGDVALDRWLSPDSERSIIGIKFRHGELSDSLGVAPGTHDVRVRLAWDDNSRTETVTAHFVEGESVALRVRVDRLTKRLSLDWR